MAAPTLLTYGPGNVDETLTLAMTNMIPAGNSNILTEITKNEFYQIHVTRRIFNRTMDHQKVNFRFE